MRMISRFCLYGLLKNQRYYEPFIILAFREKGLSFTMIGVLIGFREICINLLEVPTGAIADVIGRRRSMIFSFLAYIAAFCVFGVAQQVWMLFAAMLLFSVGEAFRTGTHKAMIFDWLSRQGRSDEKTRIYGITRSWSKFGSAVSAAIAAALVFASGSYNHIFYYCIVPYAANIVNFLGYPAYLDGPRAESPGLRGVVGTMTATIRNGIRSRPLRRLFAESMGFEGAFNVCKHYLQPVIANTALLLPVLAGLAARRRTVVLVGVVYVVVHLLSSLASRRADALARRAGSAENGARWIWKLNLIAFAVLAGSFVLPRYGLAVAIAAFVALSVLQNFWRPIQITRFADHADARQSATVLSIESQAKALFTALVAPLLGLAVDAMPDSLSFFPVGLVGLIVAAVVLAAGRKK